MTTAAPVVAPRRLLAIGASNALLGFAAEPPADLDVRRAATLGEAAAYIDEDDAIDLVVVDSGELAGGLRPELVSLAARAAVVVVTSAPVAAEQALAWIDGGAEDVLTPDELLAATAATRLGFAVARRHRHRSDAAWATDLATGLPHRRQLVEHLSQLLALRERQPSPMAVVAIRIERSVGGADVEQLRRKVAVRLRASVRAGDVVAAIDADSFCVLLASLLDASDAIAVAAKLAARLAQPYAIAGATSQIAVATGLALHPADGDQAERLVRRALALAAAAPATGAGLLYDGRAREAANDG